MIRALKLDRIHPAVWAAVVAIVAVATPARAQDAAVAVGDSLFNGKQMGACWACHGKKGVGTAAAPKLADKTWLTIDGSLASVKGAITAGVPKPKKSKTPMPPMGGAKLTPEQIDALAAYVVSISAAGK
ncbi:MAG: cytochrome c [Gemmatimonadetes bacterium]|nr:cytochrome c [Gemmatimonadota bacterium]